jgi:hypothetical protein
MTVRHVCRIGVVCVMALHTRWVHAGPPDTVGDTPFALPGIQRVPVLIEPTPQLKAALDLGYGLTESQHSEGAHHRVLGSIGVGWVPVTGLELGVLEGIRYDRHPDDGMGVDTGTIGQTQIVGRYGWRATQSVHLGADLGATFPGSEHLGDSLKSPAVDLRAIASWVPPNGVRFSGFAGYRIDRTSGVGANADYYRQGDRLALGLSEFNAALLGIGVVVPIQQFELLGEVTGDMLVGAKAPKASQSPIRIDLGLRRALSSDLQAEFLAEVSPSSRPNMAPGAPLIPAEPRFTVLLGLRYRIWHRRQQQPMPVAAHPGVTETTKPASKPEPAAAQAPLDAAIKGNARLTVDVFDGAGHPLSDATVTLTTSAGSSVLDFESGSTFAKEELPAGHAHLVVRAALMRDWEQDIELTDDSPAQLRVTMTAADSSGQIRGLIRAFDGKRLAAHIHIDPLGYDALANESGAFSVDVLPGQYQVKIWIEGYQPQLRAVDVSKNGVTVINVDLQKGGK